MNNAKTTRCKANHPMICLSEPSSIDHRQSFGALCDASSRSLSYFNHSILFNSYFIFYFIHFTVFLTVLTGARLPDEILWWLILYNANRHRLCHTIEGSINHACDPSPADGREVRSLESEELPISPSLLLTPSLPLTTASLSSSSSPSSCLRTPATSLWRSARRCSPWKGRTSARCVVPHRPLAHSPTRPPAHPPTRRAHSIVPRSTFAPSVCDKRRLPERAEGCARCWTEARVHRPRHCLLERRSRRFRLCLLEPPDTARRRGEFCRHQCEAMGERRALRRVCRGLV